ncbi:hypothetical protein GQ54DRAFT_49107 [Martensiomyces pterosporus]|nr:hypothetical protein GQ54DRAFT_49107 [Martensiomyces pterosporus]
MLEIHNVWRNPQCSAHLPGGGMPQSRLTACMPCWPARLEEAIARRHWLLSIQLCPAVSIRLAHYLARAYPACEEYRKQCASCGANSLVCVVYGALSCSESTHTIVPWVHILAMHGFCLRLPR